MKQIRSLIIILLFIGSLFGLAKPTKALELPTEEVIQLFSSDIVINKDSSLKVTETIKVVVKNEEINHGIYRDFPTKYSWKYGLKKNVGFTLIDTRLDGKVEPYRQESLTNGVRIYIGDPNKVVSTGIHTYSISYITTRQVGDFADFDELFYNVTGNAWNFPIISSTAKVSLPSKYSNDQLKAFGFTGPQGSKDANLTTTIQSTATNSIIIYSTTQELGIHEGLTMVAQWPNGAVAFSRFDSGILRIVLDNIAEIVALVFVGLLILYYLFVWIRYGIDPRKGPIVPQFRPPENLSPSAVRYIYKQAADNKSIVAALVNFGVKGVVSLEESEEGMFIFKSKTYTFTRLKNLDESNDIDERDFFERLFSYDGDKLHLKKQYNPTFSTAKDAYMKALIERHNPGNFVNNLKFTMIGIVISFLAICAVDVFNNLTNIGGFLISLPFIGFSLIFWGVGLFLLHTASKSGFTQLNGTLAFASVWFGFLFFFTSIVTGASVVSIVLIGMHLILHVIFYILLKSRTVLGSALRDQLEGFKMYLSAAENDDLKLMNKELPDTFEIYQKYLPYAIAFDVETKWTKRFEKIIAAEQLNSVNSNSYMYTNGFSSFLSSSSVSLLSNSMSSMVSSAATVPGSSSGGSGGSSGGGGGGGGGGGW